MPEEVRGTSLGRLIARVLSMAVLVVATPIAFGCGEGHGCSECNVVLISLDTLRADRLGAYGYERDTSPVIDAFAAESVVFLDVIAQAAATLASHQSLFSGLYASPRQEAPVLAEILKENGYRTGAFTGGGFLHRRFGFDRGFDDYHDSVKKTGLSNLNPLVLDWLRKNQDERFFLFLHTYDVHCPYAPPDPYRTMFAGDYEPTFKQKQACGRHLNGRDLDPKDAEFVSATYDGGVRWTDTLLQIILDELDRSGREKDTIVILLSDHGEALGEDGVFGHGMFREEAHKVPLIVRVPGVAPRVSHEPVQLVDVVPMVLSLVGIDGIAGLDGADISPVLHDAFSFEGRRPRLSLNPLGEAMFRVGDGFVLIARFGEGRDELYDLSGEWRDVASDHPEKVASLRKEFEDLRRARVGRELQPGAEPDLDAVEVDLREQLRALGYVE